MSEKIRTFAAEKTNPYMIDIFNIGNTQPDAKMAEIAARVRQRRLELNLTQASLAKRADIPLPTYRLFEKSGKISLQGLLHIAFALDCLGDFDTLFAQQKWESINDYISKTTKPRKYGKRND